MHIKDHFARSVSFTKRMKPAGTFAAIGNILLPMAVLWAACGPTDTPLDAETRLEIDTTVSNQLLYVRKEMDSICRDYEKQHLKELVDSIRQVREEEIARQLKNIPR